MDLLIAGKPWQDWAIALVGVGVAACPLVYGWGGVEGAAWAAVVFGVLLVLVGIAAMFAERHPAIGLAQVVLAVLVFFSPWLVGFQEATWFTWTMWVAGAVVAAVVGTAFVRPGARRAGAE